MIALPMTTLLKKIDPSCHITFLGRKYTGDLIDQYQDVDQFLDWEAYKALPDSLAAAQFAEKQFDICLHITPDKHIMRLMHLARIPVRIGTSRRWQGLLYCNRWMSIKRNKVPLHEAQIDMQMLWLLGGKRVYSLLELAQNYRFKALPPLPATLQHQLDINKFRLIVHPKSHGQLKGHGWNWSLEHFTQLIRMLPTDTFQVIVTGSEEEGKQLRADGFFSEKGVIDFCGKLSIPELLQCIKQADGLIAASTGPLHLAAALDVATLGLFPPMRPYNTLRWGPVGKRAEALEPIFDCSSAHAPAQCHCIDTISPNEVYEVVMRWLTARMQVLSAASAPAVLKHPA
jgi:heptosyltransferase-3